MKIKLNASRNCPNNQEEIHLESKVAAACFNLPGTWHHTPDPMSHLLIIL